MASDPSNTTAPPTELPTRSVDVVAAYSARNWHGKRVEGEVSFFLPVAVGESTDVIRCYARVEAVSRIARKERCDAPKVTVTTLIVTDPLDNAASGGAA